MIPLSNQIQRALGALVVVSALSLALEPINVLAAESSHEVKEGETLWSIAASLGVSPDELAKANDLDDPSRLSIGQVLQVPGGSNGTYEVQAGDTLSSIAARYGLTTEALLAINDLSQPDRLAIGLTLSLPASAAAPAEPAARQSTFQTVARTAGGSAATVPYLVKPGDTLTAIAASFETTLDAVLAANNMDDPNRLTVGQTVQVPAKTATHQVAQGETLAGIAAQYSVDLGSLVDFNQLGDPNLIRPGDVLAIPRAAERPEEQPPAPTLVAAAIAPPSPPPAPAEAKPAPPAQAAPASAAPAAAPAPPASLPASNNQLAKTAQALVGRPYVWGGSNEAGFDCSGLIWYVAKQVGTTISRGLQGQFNAGPHPDRNALQPGDIVFFQNTYMPGLSHNGIYVGNGKFVHAADEASGVTVSSLDDEYWSTRYFGATRLAAG